MTENYLIYPTKIINITQNHTTGNHQNHNAGNPKDYPFDEACQDTGRSWFYCPCDEVKIVKIYGLNSGGINTVWFESTKPVTMPIGAAYVTVMVEHCNDDDLKKLYVGQKFKRGEKMFREGKDGSTGNHFHVSVGTGNINGVGWVKNTKNAWVLRTTGKTLKANEAFYIDGTKIINSKGYAFKTKPKEDKPMAKLDNTPDEYAKEIIEMAKKDGIIRGDENGNYKLHEKITRQDALVFIYRAIEANK